MLPTRLSFSKNSDNFPLGLEIIGEFFVTSYEMIQINDPDIDRVHYELIQYYAQRIFPFRVEKKKIRPLKQSTNERP